MNHTIETKPATEINCLEATHLSQFLKFWMDSRNAKRTMPLSLRSVAANLGISPSMLSRLISGTRNLSIESYRVLSEKMRLSPEEKEHFQRLTESAKLAGPSRSRSDSARTPNTRYGTRRAPRGTEPSDPIESRLLSSLIDLYAQRRHSSNDQPLSQELLPSAKAIMDRCLDELARLARESRDEKPTNADVA